jgi:hypothetical protein
MLYSSDPHNQSPTQPTSQPTDTPKLKDRWSILPKDKTNMTSNTSNSNDSHSSGDSSSANNSFMYSASFNSNASSNFNEPSTSIDSPDSNDSSSNNDSSSANDPRGPSSFPDNNNGLPSAINLLVPAIPSHPLQLVNYNDARCRFCDHNRLDCPVCKPRRTNHRANNRCQAKRHIKARGKAYCCKCSYGKKTTRHFDPDDKEKITLIKYATLKSIAADELRSCITTP